RDRASLFPRLALTQSRHLVASLRLYSMPSSQRGHSQYQCGQGQQKEHDHQTDGVAPTAQVRDDGCDKKQHEADRGGYPMNGTRMPASSPSTLTALRTPSVVSHDSDTPTLAMFMRICL